MTYLIENEQAALMVPARFLGRIHPRFREVIALLAVQVADEARHVEVFTCRAMLRGGPLGTSGVGGRASLQTLLDEPDFSAASLLLSVLGEGTFLNLLSFLETHAPDPVTRRFAVAYVALGDICQLSTDWGGAAARGARPEKTPVGGWDRVGSEAGDNCPSWLGVGDSCRSSA